LQPPVPRLAKAKSSVEPPQDDEEDLEVEDLGELESDEEVASAVVAARKITAADTAAKAVLPAVAPAGVRSAVTSDDEDGGADGNSQRPRTLRLLDLGSDDDIDNNDDDGLGDYYASSASESSRKGGSVEASPNTDAAEILAVDLSEPVRSLCKRKDHSFAEGLLGRNTHKKRRLQISDFDDACDAPIRERDPAAPSLVPPDSPVFSLLQPEECKVIFASTVFDESDPYETSMLSAHVESLSHAG
jgi:hypothetical protein